MPGKLFQCCFIFNLFILINILQDGVRLCPVGPPKLKPFYLCDPSGKQLVEQFIEHYFSLYDSSHRNLLLGTYHVDAAISITCSYLSAQTTTANAR